MVIAIIQFVIDSLGAVCGAIASIMLDSPFQVVRNATIDSDILGFVNWLVPVDAIVGLLQAWVVAIGIFYVYSAIMRLVKAIE